MEKSVKAILITAIIFFVAALVGLYTILMSIHPIDLPEEKHLIVPSDRLIGYYDQDSILHIEFDNSIQFEWDAEEKDIPQIGDYIQIVGIDENIVYIAPVSNK